MGPDAAQLEPDGFALALPPRVVMGFTSLIAAAALVAAMVAAIAGAGIGSLLVPLLGIRLDFGVAVALATVPHLVAAIVRVWPLRRHIDVRVIRSFGIACAVASLAGALAHAGSAARG